MTSSRSNGDEAASTVAPPQDEYRKGVHNEIRKLWTYFSRRITIYRVAQTMVIVSAALVPVLAIWEAVPRWVLGFFGGVAVVTEGIQGLYQFHASALNAMRTANALERVLNRYMTAVTPYDGPLAKAFPVFVEDVEAIRETADEAFFKTWKAAGTQSAVER